jgi:hypothetical protein
VVKAKKKRVEMMMVNHLGENEKVWIKCVKERYFPWYLEILLTN